MNNEIKQQLNQQADNLACNYSKLQDDPLNLNNLMEYIGLLSSTVDNLLRTVAHQMDHDDDAK